MEVQSRWLLREAVLAVNGAEYLHSQFSGVDVFFRFEARVRRVHKSKNGH